MEIVGLVDCEVLSPPNDPWFEWEGGRGVEPADWSLHPEFLEQDRLRFSVGAFLVRGGPLGERVVLIDAGNGPVSDGFLPDGRLPDALCEHGVDPADVTDVLLTHLHYDHTGWLAVDGAVFFANATIHMHADDVAHFTDPASSGTSARVTPTRLDVVANRIATFTGERVLVPGINAVPAPGHTPGSTVFVASDGGTRVVFLGDAVHCPVQLVDSEWAVLGDVDPVLAARTRESLVREIAGDGGSSSTLVAGAHFPGLALGRLIGTEVPRRWSV
jgi:glyoxylase-like metal-dependent hydrolase (beta-lactamase superfamily II)